MSMTWLSLSGKVDGGGVTGEKAANPVAAWSLPNLIHVDSVLKANQIISTALSQHKIEMFAQGNYTYSMSWSAEMLTANIILVTGLLL